MATASSLTPDAFTEAVCPSSSQLRASRHRRGCPRGSVATLGRGSRWDHRVVPSLRSTEPFGLLFGAKPHQPASGSLQIAERHGHGMVSGPPLTLNGFTPWAIAGDVPPGDPAGASVVGRAPHRDAAGPRRGPPIAATTTSAAATRSGRVPRAMARRRGRRVTPRARAQLGPAIGRSGGPIDHRIHRAAQVPDLARAVGSVGRSALIDEHLLERAGPSGWRNGRWAGDAEQLGDLRRLQVEPVPRTRT